MATANIGGRAATLALLAAAVVAVGGCSTLRLPTWRTDDVPERVAIWRGVGPEADVRRIREAGAMPGESTERYTTDAGAYVREAAVSDLYEQMSGQVALERSTNSHVRAFAQRMIDHHRHTSEMLASRAVDSGLPPPPAQLDPGRAEMIRQLQTAYDFDREYLRQQRIAHYAARRTHLTYIRTGDVRLLRNGARRTIRYVEAHIRQLDRLDRRVLPR